MIEEFKRLLSDHPLTALFLFFTGAITTFLIEKLLEGFLTRIKTRSLKNELIKNSLISMNDGDVFALAHGTPYWTTGDVVTSNSKKKFIVEIPKQFHDDFLKMDQKFEFRKSVYFDEECTLQDLKKIMQIPDLELRIHKHSITVAGDLLEKQKAGRLVFNGQMLGVFDIVPDNTPLTEYRKLRIRTYDTDFFTYRVFASIYQELVKENHPISKVTKREEIIKYKPFLSSFGMCTFVMLYNQTEIVLAKRSLYTTHNENKWHYTVNEAFSQTDFDDDGNPDLFKCHVRGLQEELNIQPHLSKKTVYLLDLMFSREKFEIGVSSLIYLPDYAFGDLDFFYKCAKDGEIETDSLNIIKAKKNEVKKFIEQNDMTKGSKLALQLLMARVLNDAMPPTVT